MKEHNSLLKMILAALFLAIAYAMPFLTGQIPEIGAMLCPLHIPVLLCGFVCGWPWGLVVGFIAPLLRSFTLGMPVMFPAAVCMYCSLLTAMILGRIVWGVAMFVCMGMNGGNFTLNAFLVGAFTNAIPGIMIQIVLIPILVMILDNPKITNMRKQ